MLEDEGKKDKEKFDFTPEGEVIGYISLDQAQVLAMSTAREEPVAHGSRYLSFPMAFDVVESTETEDHYVVAMDFRPQGEFSARPGRERFFIEKEGPVAASTSAYEGCRSYTRCLDIQYFRPSAPAGVNTLSRTSRPV